MKHKSVVLITVFCLGLVTSNATAQVFIMDNFAIAECMLLEGRSRSIGLPEFWFCEISISEEPVILEPWTINYRLKFFYPPDYFYPGAIVPISRKIPIKITRSRAIIDNPFIEVNGNFHMGDEITGSFQITPVKTGNAGISILGLNYGYVIRANGETVYDDPEHTIALSSSASAIVPSRLGSGVINYRGKEEPITLDISIEPVPKVYDTSKVTCVVTAGAELRYGVNIALFVMGGIEILNFPTEKLISANMAIGETRTFDFDIVPTDSKGSTFQFNLFSYQIPLRKRAGGRSERMTTNSEQINFGYSEKSGEFVCLFGRLSPNDNPNGVIKLPNTYLKRRIMNISISAESIRMMGDTLYAKNWIQSVQKDRSTVQINDETLARRKKDLTAKEDFAKRRSDPNYIIDLAERLRKLKKDKDTTHNKESDN